MTTYRVMIVLAFVGFAAWTITDLSATGSGPYWVAWTTLVAAGVVELLAIGLLATREAAKTKARRP